MKYENILKELSMKILGIKEKYDCNIDIQKQQIIKEYENQINIIVYKLYDLTYSEVMTIEPEFSMSENEYNNYQI